MASKLVAGSVCTNPESYSDRNRLTLNPGIVSGTVLNQFKGWDRLSPDGCSYFPTLPVLFGYGVAAGVCGSGRGCQYCDGRF